MQKNEYGKRALIAHKKLRGKVSVEPKAKVKTKDDLSIYYTPGVGTVSTFLASHKDKVAEYTMKGNTVAIVSDGSAVLGLGNIGSEGALPVMEGKAMLFKALGGVDAFPIVLATQDTEAIIETVKNIAPVFGGINLEDISAPRCFEIEKRLQETLDIPVIHDDQHGTAMVVLAGMINAFKVVKKDMKKSTIVIAGAGAAGQAIGDLLILSGVGNIIMVDSKGVISSERTDLDVYKKELLKRTNKNDVQGGLKEALSGADAFVGVSKGNTLAPSYIQEMASKPIIFALANPVPEIMPDEAKKAGAYVVATGRSDFANQVNNSLGFPGIFRGALDHKVKKITDAMLLDASKNLARLVEKPSVDMILPNAFDKRVVPAVAKAIKEKK